MTRYAFHSPVTAGAVPRTVQRPRSFRVRRVLPALVFKVHTVFLPLVIRQLIRWSAFVRWLEVDRVTVLPALTFPEAGALIVAVCFPGVRVTGQDSVTPR